MPTESDPTQSGPDPAQTGLTTREISRFVTYYLKHVRAHSKADCVGVIRQIQRLIEKGLPAEDIAVALENYAQDPWRKQQDPRFTKSIRSFFTAENIRAWLTPRQVRPMDPLAHIHRFQADVAPKPVEVLPVDDDTVEDEL